MAVREDIADTGVGMNELNWKKTGVLFLLILLLAVYQDVFGSSIEADAVILREEAGGTDKTVYLILNGEDVLQDYSYELHIEAAKISKEEAEEMFACVRKDIDKDFQTIGEMVPMAESYMDGMVEADWDFGTCECINSKGEILQEHVPEDGMTVYAEVVLVCGNYESVYAFPFYIEKKVLSEQEELLLALEEWMMQQMELEGTKKVQLPESLNGVSLQWSEKRESLVIQVLIFEIIAAAALWWGQKKQQEQEEKKRIQSYEWEYPDLVNQLFILLQAGMTTRQAWAKIAAQYELKRKKQLIPEKAVYEQILYLNRRLLEGESERTAYQKFADEINVRLYYRLMRTLSNNLEKGTSGLCRLLEEESRQAYEQRILMAKRLGEEASTKMLIPLMGMLILVFGIVLLPALIGTGI